SRSSQDRPACRTLGDGRGKKNGGAILRLRVTGIPGDPPRLERVRRVAYFLGDPRLQMPNRRPGSCMPSTTFGQGFWRLADPKISLASFASMGLGLAA